MQYKRTPTGTQVEPHCTKGSVGADATDNNSRQTSENATTQGSRGEDVTSVSKDMNIGSGTEADAERGDDVLSDSSTNEDEEGVDADEVGVWSKTAQRKREEEFQQKGMRNTTARDMQRRQETEADRTDRRRQREEELQRKYPGLTIDGLPAFEWACQKRGM